MAVYAPRSYYTALIKFQCHSIVAVAAWEDRITSLLTVIASVV